MRIIDSGTIVEGIADGSEACNTFPAVAVLSNGTMLLTCRSGSTKDCVDEHVRLFTSGPDAVFGEIPSPFEAPVLEGRTGSLKLCYLTEISHGELIAAALWVDRSTYPGKGLFNEETEGCLPMAVIVCRSTDFGQSWSPFVPVALPDDIGPPSLTNPIVRLSNGELLLSIETNKSYLDTGAWKQRAVLLRSSDNGETWTGPVTVAEDPAGRLCHWDQRIGVLPDDTICTYCWMYDRVQKQYLPIRSRFGRDGGREWGSPTSLGFSDQPAHPAITRDGRTLLAYVDRFSTQSIRARLADPAGNFRDDSDTILYSHNDGSTPASDGQLPGTRRTRSTGELLGEMSLWSFGLPYGEILPNKDALVLYYAGTDRVMDIRYCRISL